jgi:hypothetical protein
MLRVVGASAVATGLAGCQDATQQSYEFTADPVEYAGDPAEAGYAEESQETVTAKRTESVGGVDAEVTVNSQVAIYSSERDTEPMDVEGLWADDGGTLAEWTIANPLQAIRASEVVEGESLTLQTGDGDGSIPAAAAQVWAPNPQFDELSVADLLVAVPVGDEAGSLPPLPYDERDSYRFGSEEFFPAGTSLDVESGIYVAGREGM